MKNKPEQGFPIWPIKLLRFFVKTEYLEEIEGDLEEIYLDNLESIGKRRANKRFIIDTLKLIRPNLLKQTTWIQKLEILIMLRNNLKIAFRNLLKFKVNSAINLIGLSIALTLGSLALLHTLDELSYDNFHAKKDKIYKIVSKPDQGATLETNGWPVASTIKSQFPEVASVIYTRRAHPSLKVNDNGQKFTHSTFYASKDFFELFSFPFLEGDPKTALDHPNSIVITEAIKNRYFKGDALGETLTFRDSLKYVVTGVLSPLPSNSHIQFDLLISFATYVDQSNFDYTTGWGNFNVRNYLLLNDGADINALKEKAKNLYQENAGQWLEQMGISFSIDFIPLEDIYLHAGIPNGFGPLGKKSHLQIIIIVAFFAICLAAINYINLNTARSIDRAKEIGVRKVNGSKKSTLIFQFLSESFITTILALVLALSILSISVPFFNNLIDKRYSIESLLNVQLLSFIGILAVAISLLAGYYPALVLSSLKPIEALKGKVKSNQRGLSLRKSLIVFQFFITAIMILATFIVLDQTRFMRDQDLGFDKEQVLIIDATNAPRTNTRKIFKDQLAQIPGINHISYTNALPAKPGWQGQWAYPENDSESHIDTEYMAVDEDYLQTLKIKVIAGNNFNINNKGDLEDGLLINETFVKAMNWESPMAAIGRKIDSPSGYPAGTVIGVIKDYHGLGLQNEIWPKAMDYSSDRFGRYFAIRFTTGDTKEIVYKIEELWDNLFKGNSFEFYFLNDNFDLQYQKEDQLASVLSVFAIIILIISGIGLFGLISFISINRTKEVGIRKTLGASVFQIVYLFAKDFLWLVVLGNLMAIPIIVYFGSEWLENFAYRTYLKPETFVWSIVITTLVSCAIICYQTIGTARINPAKSLKYE